MDIESEQSSFAPEPSGKKTPRLSSRTVKIFLFLGILLALVIGTTSLAYARPPTDPLVRRIVGTIPYPAAVVDGEVVTVRAYLEERDALNTYFETAAAETGTVPSEDEITRNIMQTLLNKVAVRRLADAEGVTLDTDRVETFYEEASGGADPEAFSEQLEAMFGWSAEEFRTRVIAPVVLATQLSEHLAEDVDRQAERRAKAEAAYARVEAGEDFSIVATDTGGDVSAAAQGGDVGYVDMQDVPPEWQQEVDALALGEHSSVLEGTESFLVLRVTDRVTAGDQTQVRLSVISFPKLSLEEWVQSYLESASVWRFIGRT